MTVSNERDAWRRVLQRSVTDKAYRGRLLTNPSSALKEEGVTLAQGMTVTVVEFDPRHAYLILPPFGAPVSDGDILPLQHKGGANG